VARRRPRFKRQHQVAPDAEVIADESVVDEQPASVAERVAVGVPNRSSSRGADVREEEGRRDAVAPCRGNAAIQARGSLRRTSRIPKPSALVRCVVNRAARLCSISEWLAL
jgi:hypothetical protein